MTVKELKLILATLDDDVIVLTGEPDDENPLEIEEVEIGYYQSDGGMFASEDIWHAPFSTTLGGQRAVLLMTERY